MSKVHNYGIEESMHDHAYSGTSKQRSRNVLAFGSSIISTASANTVQVGGGSICFNHSDNVSRK